jgi:hypothetical protein
MTRDPLLLGWPGAAGGVGAAVALQAGVGAAGELVALVESSWRWWSVKAAE